MKSLFSALYVGDVFHRRTQPTVHQLRYRVFSMLIDLSEVTLLTQRLKWFSHNRWNLFSFYDKDFGDAAVTEELETYVARKLVENGISQTPERIMLSCYPRVCGYQFNPLSLFYCYDENNTIFAILHEVHNTFGERHVYVLAANLPVTSDASRWAIQHAEKALFVSPFAHMNMRYRFRINKPESRQRIVISVNAPEGHILTAAYKADRQVLNDTNLMKQFLSVPMLCVKVVLGIHWQALKLWLKRVPLVKHVAKIQIQNN